MLLYMSQHRGFIQHIKILCNDDNPVNDGISFGVSVQED